MGPWVAEPADPRSGIQRLVLYLVRSTPSGNVGVPTRFGFTQLSRAVKSGVPPPTDRMGDDRVLVDQPGPHSRRGEGGAGDARVLVPEALRRRRDARSCLQLKEADVVGTCAP
jgi:hypothetical protein